MKSIIIDGKKFSISGYSSFEDLVDTEFEGKDLSKIKVEDLEGIPYRLEYKTSIPCTLEEALEDIEGLGTIFDWVDYVENNPRREEATIVYIDNFWDWESSDFEDSYYGYFTSEEDFAENYLEDIGWDIDLSDYFDYEAYGEMRYNDFNLEEYTPEALADYREELGLSEDYNDSDSSSMNKKELERKYGFIGDYEGEEEEDTFDDNSDIDLTEAQEEYDRFVEDHSWEIYLAEEYSLDGYEGIARAEINEYWNGIDDFLENSGYGRDFIDMESFTQSLFNYDYIYIDGYVFRNN